MDTTLLYNVPPPAGKLNGVFVTADSPGIPPFAFHAQHGSMKSDVTPDDVTGFAACTKAVSVRVRDARKRQRKLCVNWRMTESPTKWMRRPASDCTSSPDEETHVRGAACASAASAPS